MVAGLSRYREEFVQQWTCSDKTGEWNEEHEQSVWSASFIWWGYTILTFPQEPMKSRAPQLHLEYRFY